MSYPHSEATKAGTLSALMAIAIAAVIGILLISGALVGISRNAVADRPAFTNVQLPN